MMSREEYAHLNSVIKAMYAYVEQMYRSTLPPVTYEGLRVEGVSVLFHLEDNAAMISGCNVGSRDLRNGIKAICFSLVKNYDIPKPVLSLELVSIAEAVMKHEMGEEFDKK